MEDCLFCKISVGEIPSTKIYEDDLMFVFADINPTAPVHWLAIPKKHIASVNEITTDNSHIVAHIFEVIPKIATKDEFKNGYRIVSNIGDDAGQTVKHLHFHILAGREFGWPAG